MRHKADTTSVICVVNFCKEENYIKKAVQDFVNNQKVRDSPPSVSKSGQIHRSSI